MILNMRANGVCTLAAWCLGRGCDHNAVLTTYERRIFVAVHLSFFTPRAISRHVINSV
jgi:hypothetical protein